jgi:hypothetical protein
MKATAEFNAWRKWADACARVKSKALEEFYRINRTATGGHESLSRKAMVYAADAAVKDKECADLKRTWFALKVAQEVKP